MIPAFIGVPAARLKTRCPHQRLQHKNFITYSFLHYLWPHSCRILSNRSCDGGKETKKKKKNEGLINSDGQIWKNTNKKKRGKLGHRSKAETRKKEATFVFPGC